MFLLLTTKVNHFFISGIYSIMVRKGKDWPPKPEKKKPEEPLNDDDGSDGLDGKGSTKERAKPTTENTTKTVSESSVGRGPPKEAETPSEDKAVPKGSDGSDGRGRPKEAVTEDIKGSEGSAMATGKINHFKCPYCNTFSTNRGSYLTTHIGFCKIKVNLVVF